MAIVVENGNFFADAPYDFIFSLGESCSTSIMLRKCGLQTYSMPFDWSGAFDHHIAGTCGLLGKLNMMKNKFEGAFELEDLYEENWGVPGEHRFVRNKKTGLQYLHDFPWTHSIEKEFPSYKEKYMRRIKRFYQKMESSKRICIVFIVVWDGRLTPHVLQLACDEIHAMYPDKEIDFFILQKNDEMNLYQSRLVKFSDHILFGFFKSTEPGNDINNPASISFMEKLISCFLRRQYINFIHEDDIFYSGFFHDMDEGIWSYDYSAMLLVHKKNWLQGTLTCRFDLVPFVNDVHQELKTDVCCNGISVAKWHFKHGESVDTDIVLDERFLQDRDLLFTFYFNAPASPKDCGTGDELRKLGIHLKSLSLTENRLRQGALA